MNARHAQRRRFLKILSGLGMAAFVPQSAIRAAQDAILSRPIPKTGERLPIIGMGSWLTFAVDDDPQALAARVKVLQAFFEAGGRLIDSSPMYGSSEEVIGYCLDKLDKTEEVFSATKVWTSGWQAGVRQMHRSRALWNVARVDLMQIHNMLDWETHLQTLRAWKEEGRIRYIGITTSHGRRHTDLVRVLSKEDAFDFVQFTYNIEDREAEQRLLPLAAERRLAVLINRPFQRGGLFDHAAGKPLPPWAAEIGVQSWAQFFLKFVVSHPAVTCAIPATSRVDHMQENMAVLRGPLPDPRMRQKMLDYYKSI